MAAGTYVKVYKTSNNGEFAVQTNATDYREFEPLASAALINVVHARPGDEEFTVAGVFPAMVELACKLKGYKADSVQEQRVLSVGSYAPRDDELIATEGESLPLVTLEPAKV